VLGIRCGAILCPAETTCRWPKAEVLDARHVACEHAQPTQVIARGCIGDRVIWRASDSHVSHRPSARCGVEQVGDLVVSDRGSRRLGPIQHRPGNKGKIRRVTDGCCCRADVVMGVHVRVVECSLIRSATARTEVVFDR